jgi:hypothetical protein
MKKRLIGILNHYRESFSKKTIHKSKGNSDILMEVFGITHQIKAKNMQYWGRELGMCWQLLVVEIFKKSCRNFKPALKVGSDEPCDLLVGNLAIDTKYRVGSGDSGTLKKFKQYGNLLMGKGYQPVMLFLREDNLKAAITALKSGGWKIYKGDESFKFIKKQTNFDFKKWLKRNKGKFTI